MLDSDRLTDKQIVRVYHICQEEFKAQERLGLAEENHFDEWWVLLGEVALALKTGVPLWDKKQSA